MSVTTRGVMNAFRNTIRSISITAILALTIALALVMLLSLKVVQARIDDVKSSGSNSESGATSGNVPQGNFVLPITVTGTTAPGSTTVSGVNSFKLTAGENIDGSSSDYVALVGKALAKKNNLSVGSTFTAYGQTITVKGIYDTGNTFTNAGVIMPLSALQKLSSQEGDITSAIVTVDNVDHLDATVSALEKKLGNSADVVSDASASADTLSSLDNVKTIATYSLIGALVAGSVIIFLSMLMIVRERRREIGVLKAIGSSNAKISWQFVSEALTLTGMAAVIGVIGGIILSNPVLD